MKAKAVLLFISFACGSTAYSFGQIDCTTSKKLACQFPVSATTLAVNTVGIQALKFAQSAATPINSSIAGQLTQLPVPSATVGVVSLRQKGSEIGVPFENLGPVLTDRPDTVGKGHLFMGFSYQHFNFNALDGFDLGSLPVAFTFNQTVQSNGQPDQQSVYAKMINNVSFKLDQYVGVATVGVTKTTDLSLIVPFNSVKLAVLSSDFHAYIYDSFSGTYQTPSLPAGTTVPSSGSSSGIGDVTVSLKQLLVGGEGSRTAIAAGASLRFPSGDSLNYLGSGAVGGNMYGLFEYRARLAPHFKLGYQWNDVSKLVNPQGGTNRLPGGLQYDAGADLKLVRSLTLAADILGNQFVNAPSFAENTLTLNPAPPANSVVPSTFTVVSPLNNTYTTVNGSAGLKWSPIPHFLLYGNVLMAMNNVGLRSDPVPLFGIAYNFKASRKK